MEEESKKVMVTNSHVHAETGHMNIEVQTVTTQGNVTFKGPKVTYGCDAHMFQKMFNSDVNQLKTWIKSQHLAYHGAHQELMDAVGNLKDTEI